VAEVARRVVGLLERAQDQRRQRHPPVAGAADVLVDEARALRDDLGGLLG
jgi:hypothetical protein